MGLIGAQYAELGISESEYMTYIFSIPFNFYSILAIILVGIIVFLKWDFGPMAQAEYRARTSGKVYRDDAAPPSDDQMSDVEMPEGYTPKSGI